MAKHGNIQITAEYLAARLVLGLLSRLPMSVSMAIGRAVGRAAYTLASGLRRTGQTNLRLAFPETSDDERRKLLLGCFRSLGRELGVFSHFLNGSAASLREICEFTGVENLERSKALGKGVVLFTGHLGAWELTSFGSSLIGHPLTFLVRRLDNPKVEQLVDRARTRFGNQTVNKLGAARSMVKILRSAEVLGLLLDLNTLDEEGIFVDFFGVPASTSFMVAKLALRTQSPIVPLFSPWNEDKKKFAVQFYEPIIPKASADEEADVRRVTTELSLFIENRIREYPDQWLWIHRRWKTRPPGEPSIY
jgi:KDO2-lipid IV(A) lauroyltransferase